MGSAMHFLPKLHQEVNLKQEKKKQSTVERRAKILYTPPICTELPGRSQAFGGHRTFTNLSESSYLLLSFSTQHFKTRVRGCLGPLGHGGSGCEETAPEC